jgi:hypothetical protein
MATISQVYQSIANINLWFKLQAGDQLVLTDIPAIISLRWTYFAQNWNKLLPSLKQKISSYIYPDLLAAQLIEFTNFIEQQRNSATKINPLTNVETQYRFYTIFDSITINSIKLTLEENTIVRDTTTKVSQYNKQDFLTLQNNISSYRDTLGDTLGLTDSTYNSTFARSPAAAQKNAQVQDIQYLTTLQTSLQSIDFILANLFAVDTAVDPFSAARANTNNPDINIGQYSSGQLVRFNYGDDLESLATRYLGDPTRWLDIALANGLQPPYVDEVGSTVPLQSNASGSQINIAAIDAQGNDNSTKFYINQTIFLTCTTVPFPNQVKITNIVQIPSSGDLVITVDNNQLSQYTTANQATVLVYTPDTINSHQFILIPSTEPLPNQRQDTVPWFLAKSPEDEKLMGIDLLLNGADDLVFTSNHDIALSYALQNAVQAMRLKVVTELGELRYHQGFGLVSVIGNKNNTLELTKNAVINSLTSQVAQDARFDRIESINVFYVSNVNQAPALVISMEVRLAGGRNQVIPITFSVNYT